jgi:hypothetical protein
MQQIASEFTLTRNTTSFQLTLSLRFLIYGLLAHLNHIVLQSQGQDAEI